jgi:hypothetical protein
MFLGLKLSLNVERTTSVTPPAPGPFYYIRTAGTGVYLRPGTIDRYTRP